MTTKGWTMSAAALAVAAGVYFALETLRPQQHDTTAALPTLSADEVFAGTLDEAAGARAVTDAQPTEPAADASAEGELAGDIAGEIPVETASAEADLEEAGDPESSAETSGVDAGAHGEDANEVAATQAPAEAAGAAEFADAVVSDAQAPAEVSAEAVAEASVEPSAAPPTETSAEKSVETSTQTPAAHTEDAAPAPAPAAVAAQASKPAARTPTLSEWWRTEAPGALQLQYAGSVAGRHAIALLFSGDFGSTESADRNALVFDLQGQRIEGQWTIGSKASVLEFNVPSAGYYTVMVSGALQDASGATLGKTLKGPVHVK